MRGRWNEVMHPAPPRLASTDRFALRQAASWIRDDVDVKIAREGPEVMGPDEVLLLHDLFVQLRQSDVSLATLKYSRIHHAVREVAGKATRWPGRLIDVCDELIRKWEERFGPLREVKGHLYEAGGRLHGVCEVGDLGKQALMARWNEKCPEVFFQERSKSIGSLGFHAGAWWLNAIFAFKDGIIDLETAEGGIDYDDKGVYAVVIKDDSEIEGPDPTAFTYRCKPHDPGRFRLTSAKWETVAAIRVLRSHSLSSLWGPRCGIRYEGLYKVAGWVIKGCNPDTNQGADVVFEVKFERLSEQRPMQEVLRHPLAEEVDDYQEYKRLRRVYREAQKHKLKHHGLGHILVSRIHVSGKESPRSSERDKMSSLDVTTDAKRRRGGVKPFGKMCPSALPRPPDCEIEPKRASRWEDLLDSSIPESHQR